MSETLVKGNNVLPLITYDPSINEIGVSGWSFSERPLQVFEPVFKILESHEGKPLTFQYKLNCFNTATSKCLILLTEKMKELHSAGTDIKVIWHFDSDDDETKEWGEDISSVTGFEFEFQPY
jgi:SiaC family regulatory phosphoprotein